jgi:hypothetical protein
MKYCAGRDRSRWYWAVREARVSSLMCRPLVIEPIGSAGVRRMRKKITAETTNIMGIRERRRLRI